MVLPQFVIGAIIIGVLFVMLWGGGLGAGFGLIHILNSIPWWGWLIILFIILMLFRNKKGGK